MQERNLESAVVEFILRPGESQFFYGRLDSDCAQRAELKIATASRPSIRSSKSLHGKASTSYFFPRCSSFGSLGPSVSQSPSPSLSLSQSASRFHYLGRSVRPSGRPSALCTGFAGPRGPLSLPSLSFSHPRLHVQFHLQNETPTCGVSSSRCKSEKSDVAQVSRLTISTEGRYFFAVVISCRGRCLTQITSKEQNMKLLSLAAAAFCENRRSSIVSFQVCSKHYQQVQLTHVVLDM